MEQHPAALNSIIGKAQQAARAAEAARKARELVRRKAVLGRTTLPGKLADCSSTNFAETEIFVVEGDSAGGRRGHTLPCVQHSVMCDMMSDE